jgi:hypothetical protein
MDVKRLAVATAVAISALVSAAAPVGAVPPDPPPPCADCQPDPGGPQIAPPPLHATAPAHRPCWTGGRVGPGSPRGGGGQPAYPPQCPPTTHQP